MKIVWIFAAMLIAVLLLGCAQQAPQGNTTSSPANNTSSVVVQMSGFRFNPADIQVAVGTTVMWINNDPAMHTVTFDNGQFDSGDFPHGDNRSYTFTTAGNFTYHCTIHPSMKGSVTVK